MYRICTIMVWVLLALPTGCTAARQEFKTAANGGISEELIGWIVFSNGGEPQSEFWFYKNKSDIKNTYPPTNCLSGAFPIDIQSTLVKQLNKKKVKITGRKINTSAMFTPDTLSIEYKGVVIKNDCFGKSIIFGDKIIQIE